MGAQPPYLRLHIPFPATACFTFKVRPVFTVLKHRMHTTTLTTRILCFPYVCYRGEIPDLFFFKALTRELQCPAVLRDRANDVIRGSRRHLGCYFEGHRDLSSHQAGKMRDHLVSNPARIAAYPRGIKRSGPMKPRRLRRRRCARRNLPGVRSSAWNRTLSTRPCADNFAAVRRLCTFGIKLSTGDIRLDEQSRSSGGPARAPRTAAPCRPRWGAIRRSAAR